MIEFSKVTQENGEDGNSIIIHLQVELTEEDAQDYIELDEILRNIQYNNVAPLKDVFGDIMCDYGLSYSDDILAASDWTKLGEALLALQDVVENAKIGGLL